MKKTAVITAATRDYDDIKPYPVKGNAQYIAFAEEIFESDFFEVREICAHFKEPCRNAKIHKILMHKYSDADYLIWIDANVQLTVAPQTLIDEFLEDADIAVFKHPFRDCVYAEGEECIHCGKDDKDVISRHLNRYSDAGYPEHNGLAECSMIVRRNLPQVNTLCEKWWAEISVGSRRDQISFPFVFTEYGYKAVEVNVRDFDYFIFRKHKIDQINEALPLNQ